MMFKAFFFTIIREPLFQFFLIAGVFFSVSSVSGSRAQPDNDKHIVVTQGEINNLIGIHERTWGIPPSGEEIEQLIAKFIEDEVLYREALKVGLAEDDVIIRRRLRQKLEFVARETAVAEPPSEADLQKFLAVNAERFSTPQNFSFQQVYFTSGDADEPRFATLKQLLSSQEMTDNELASLGDFSSLRTSYSELTNSELEQIFGDKFSEQLRAISSQQWQGPITSQHGVHLVRLQSHQPSQLPELVDVRPLIEREYQYQAISQAQQDFFGALKAQYEINVESLP